ncbi:hypothetical protein CSB95_5034 [Pseudomonas aeruginosa]|nr:hypothetical protein CSC29_0750 [Pseudomonas aeruginosa]AWZ95429.1 hypothetical protein CSC46_5981 [Pseudomonas aeruginosa]PRV99528.1 hypothetical protein CSB88_4390 [Pseudomonas aeruginosa]PRW10910.1 hypothetical protein CSB95_5034 [Pseudomonas aeruginosa]PRW29134.1 hypothetical protein CSB96_0152 [Pseudomonas aeruginosa]
MTWFLWAAGVERVCDRRPRRACLAATRRRADCDAGTGRRAARIKPARRRGNR